MIKNKQVYGNNKDIDTNSLGASLKSYFSPQKKVSTYCIFSYLDKYSTPIFLGLYPCVTPPCSRTTSPCPFLRQFYKFLSCYLLTKNNIICNKMPIADETNEHMLQIGGLF